MSPMNEKPATHSGANEETLIRETCEEMNVPVNRERMQRAFVESARQQFPQRRFRMREGLAWLFAPRVAFAVSAGYVAAAFIYCLVTIADSPVRQIDGKTPGWNLSFRTALGQPIYYTENKTVSLEDGTRMICLEPSLFSVSYLPQERHVELSQGKIEITATPNTQKPMIVSVGDTRIKVTGTRFIVSVTNSIIHQERNP